MKTFAFALAIIGALCLHNVAAGTYGRGAGRSPCTGCSGCSGCGWGGCSGCSGCSSCSTSHCRANEDVNGALCYPKCRAGYSPVGCCLCSGSPPAPPTRQPTKQPTFFGSLLRKKAVCEDNFKVSDAKSAAQCSVDASQNLGCDGRYMFAEDQKQWGCWCCRPGSQIEPHTWWSVYTHATRKPTAKPTAKPTVQPTKVPTLDPTMSPTTKEPTTKEPTTKEPTTKEPTTKEPTTKEPTTKEPTTKEPTTPTPTTPGPTDTAQPTEPVDDVVEDDDLPNRQPVDEIPSKSNVPIFIGVGAGCAVLATIIIGAVIMQSRTTKKKSSSSLDSNEDDITVDVYGGRVMFKNPTFSHSNE